MYFYNESVKTLAKLLAFLYVLIGLLFVGYGLYVVFLPWGSADKESYLAIGIVLTLFGTALTCVSTFGFLAAEHQLKRFGKGWSGRAAIALYMMYLICVLAAIILAYIYGNNWLDETNDKISLMTANPTANPPFSTLERPIRDHFNVLYFHVQDHCSDKFTWFWSYIRHHCPAGLHKPACERCEEYYVTMCTAYEPICYADDGSVDKGNNFACPYFNCRRQTLQYIHFTSEKCFDYIMYGLGGTTALQIFLNLLLICHVQKRKMVITVIDGVDDDDEELLQAANWSGTSGGGRGSEKLSSKSEELSYHVYSFSEKVEMPAQRGTVAAPPAASARQTEDALIDSYIQMTAQYSGATVAAPPSNGSWENGAANNGTTAGTGAHAPLANTHHKPTAYSTYQLNMEIALAESMQAEAGATGSRGTRSDEDLARALAASKAQQPER